MFSDVKKVKDVVICEKSDGPVIAAEDLELSESFEHSMPHSDSIDALLVENPVEAIIDVKVEEYSSDQITTEILHPVEQLTTLDSVTAHGVILDTQVNRPATEEQSGKSNPTRDIVLLTDCVNEITLNDDQMLEPASSSSLGVLDHVESLALKDQNQGAEYQVDLCHDRAESLDTADTYINQSQGFSTADYPTATSSSEVVAVVEKGAYVNDAASYINAGVVFNTKRQGARVIDVTKHVEQDLILNDKNEINNLNGRHRADTKVAIGHVDTLTSYSESVIQADTDRCGNVEANAVYNMSLNTTETGSPTSSLSQCSDDLKKVITNNLEKSYLDGLDNLVLGYVCDSSGNATSCGQHTNDLIPIDSVTFPLGDSRELETGDSTEEISMSHENSLARDGYAAASGILVPFITRVPLISTEPWPNQGDHSVGHLDGGDSTRVTECLQEVMVNTDEIDKWYKNSRGSGITIPRKGIFMAH